MSEEDVIPETGAVFTYGKSSFADNIPSHFFIRNDPVVEISCGEEHSGIVCKNGRVFCFGKNSFGQLGLGHTENVYKPNCVKNLKPDKVKHIACGRSHTIVSTENNTVYGFGDNGVGQLGRPVPDVISSDVPVEVTRFDDEIVQIAAGSYHTAVLLGTGDVYVWGSNSVGQLGLDSTDEDSVSVWVPTVVPVVQPVVHVSCGHGHTAFVTKAGDLFTCGDREYGKLGHDLWSLGRVDTAEKIVQVACGANHTVALNDVGEAFVCGNNDCGQIGLRNVTSQARPYPCAIANERIVRVTCGDSHSAFVTASGKLYTCGDGKYGKLCADVNRMTVPTLVSSFVDRRLNVRMAGCGGDHTLVHAEPADDGQRAKSADSLPPLKVAKKTTDGRNETAGPFASVIASATNGDHRAAAVLIVAVEEIAQAYETDDASTAIDRQINADKKNSHCNASSSSSSSSSSSTAETTCASTNDKSLENDAKKSSNNMLVNSTSNEQKKEKKVVNKSKYPRNERIRSRMCVFI